MEEESSGNVQVVCRFRPLNEKEQNMSDSLCIDFSCNQKTVLVVPQGEPGVGAHRFNFDYVFTPSATQQEVYRCSAEPIVEAVMQGFNGTVFAYGQTSSGKTFTMTGPSIDDSEMKGIIPRMVSTVFNNIANSSEQIEFSVKVAYAEIYLEKIRDLINPSKNNLKIHEDKTRGVHIPDLSEHYVSSEYEVYELMRIGSSNREVGFTKMNAGSSRSHSLFILTVTQNNTLDLSVKTGKLYLVDLAGSEKVGKTGAEGKRLEEAKNINKSLTTLGQVISALTDGKSSHIPYRDSKLTRVLQDSLGGNSKTALIVTCSPSPYNEAETISTLRFGIRAKAVKNKPKVNREYTVAELKLMLANAKEEIAKRDRKIKSLETTLKNTGVPLVMADEVKSDDDVNYEKCQEMDEVIQELEEIRTRLSQEAEAHLAAEHALYASKAETEEIRQEILRLRDFYYDQNEEIKLKDQRIKGLEDQNDDLAMTKEMLQSDLEAANTSILHMQQQINAKNVEFERLRIDIKKTRNAFDHLELEDVDIYNLETSIDSKFTESSALEDTYLSPNFEMKSKKTEEKLANSCTQCEKEQERAKKINQELKTRLLQVRKSYKYLEGTLKDDERYQTRKIETLERNLEQLTMVYHQLFNQKNSMKVENLVKTRKLKKLDSKVENLEYDLKKTRKELQSAQNTIKELNVQIESMNNKHEHLCGNTSLFNGHKNIRKTVKGGRGKSMMILPI